MLCVTGINAEDDVANGVGGSGGVGFGGAGGGGGGGVAGFGGGAGAGSGSGLGASGAASDDADEFPPVTLPASDDPRPCKLARMVPALASHSSSPSSSARLANMSGSSSSGGSADIQHIRAGSNIMLPTTRAPDAKDPTGEPMDDPVS